MRFLIALTALALAIPSLAQDVVRDVHSYAQPDKVVIRDLGLDLRVDFEQKQIRGHADLALEWKDEKARELHLDTRDLMINGVSGKAADGRWFKLDFELAERDPALGQKLTINMRRPYHNGWSRQ